ncbi:hypothetical protein ACFOZ1_02085 [Gracilibacillus marinus]|uniref:Uncharacterized protein n=1 Tax=Gracilibacillus marinus TaxID=630535 RepID=A0ABV8VRK4_9BACI
MSSLVFAIYYFFAYIIIENKYIKNRILEQELLGHYIKSKDKTSYNPDIVAKIEDGMRTNKKLSLNVIRFFDKTNTDAEILFEEAFGPNSIIYNRKKQSKMLKQMKMDATPYVYREDTSLVRDISHEFFQLYRYSEAQDRWLIYIANLFRPENEDSKKKSIIYVCNTLRIISQINTFGQSDNLFTYKFMDYFRGDVEFIIRHSTVDRTEEAALFEELAIQWTTYMIRVILSDENLELSSVIDRHAEIIMIQDSHAKQQQYVIAKKLYEKFYKADEEIQTKLENAVAQFILKYAEAYNEKTDYARLIRDFQKDLHGNQEKDSLVMVKKAMYMED